MQRQLPIINHYAATCQMALFAYGSSFQMSRALFQDNPNVRVFEVAVPFYVGNKTGIDFEATKKLEKNAVDFDSINHQAVNAMMQWLGKPDLVISDYEPISAQVAYDNNVPLITIDQQSKYLVGDFPETLHECTYHDEVARLKLFFPKAAERIACSFFKVPEKETEMRVTVVPPIIKDSVLTIKRNPSASRKTILVYLTNNQSIPQTFESVVETFASFDGIDFHIFAPVPYLGIIPSHIIWNTYDDPEFIKILSFAHGIITTAGHTLIAEAMYLGIPVYALPLPIYEQQMNARVIAENNFGVMSETINEKMAREFIENLSEYSDNIVQDPRHALNQGNGIKQVISILDQYLTFK